MRKLTAFFVLLATLSFGQTRLTDKAEISVLTLGPSDRHLYTAFGHSAFRVFDPTNNINEVYNYGVFNFNRPNFYLNFARGNNVYELGVNDYREFEYSYIYFDRYIHEQKLNLTANQKQRLYDFLQWNALPENKEYLYDYFYDNCATKIPEVMVKVFGDTVRFDTTPPTDFSIRQLTDLYLENQPWGDLGIDICLGLPMDKKTSAYEHMFLPEYVESNFAKATIMKAGRPYPLTKESIVRYRSQNPSEPATFLKPLLIFGLLFIVISIISYFDIKRKKLTKWLDGTLFGLVGAIGLLLLILWIATDHRAAARNLNIIWALPTHIIAAIALVRNPKWLQGYFIIVAVLNLLLLAAWLVLPQQLHYALIPVVMALALRSYTQYLIRKQGTIQQTTIPSQVQIQP